MGRCALVGKPSGAQRCTTPRCERVPRIWWFGLCWRDLSMSCAALAACQAGVGLSWLQIGPLDFGLFLNKACCIFTFENRYRFETLRIPHRLSAQRADIDVPYVVISTGGTGGRKYDSEPRRQLVQILLPRLRIYFTFGQPPDGGCCITFRIPILPKHLLLRDKAIAV